MWTGVLVVVVEEEEGQREGEAEASRSHAGAPEAMGAMACSLLVCGCRQDQPGDVDNRGGRRRGEIHNENTDTCRIQWPC